MFYLNSPSELRPVSIEKVGNALGCWGGGEGLWSLLFLTVFHGFPHVFRLFHAQLFSLSVIELKTLLSGHMRGMVLTITTSSSVMVDLTAGERVVRKFQQRRKTYPLALSHGLESQIGLKKEASKCPFSDWMYGRQPHATVRVSSGCMLRLGHRIS